MQNNNDASNSYNELEIINAGDVRDLIAQCLSCKINLLIYGEPGCGKSAIIEGLAREGLYNLVQLGAASLCEEAINGFPTKDDASSVVKYTMPEWLATIEENYKREPEKPQILFIDELTLAAPEVMNSLQILLTARALPMHASHKLPDNVVIVSATNTAEDSNEGTELSRPLKTRFMTVRMQNTPENYKEYILAKIEGGDIMQNILQVIGEERTRQFVDDTLTDFREFWCDNTQFYGTNPRTIMNFYNACDYVAKEKGELNPSDVKTIAKRTVGHATATTNWVNGEKLVAAVQTKKDAKSKFPTEEEIANMSKQELEWAREDISRSTKCTSAAAIMAICQINARLIEMEEEN